MVRRIYSFIQANLIYIDKGSSFATMLEAFAEIGYFWC